MTSCLLSPKTKLFRNGVNSLRVRDFVLEEQILFYKSKFFPIRLGQLLSRLHCHLNQHTEFIHTVVLLFQSSKVEPEYLDMSNNWRADIENIEQTQKPSLLFSLLSCGPCFQRI